MCNFRFAVVFLVSSFIGANAQDPFLSKGLDLTASVDPKALLTAGKNLLSDTWGHKEDVAHASLRRLICPMVADLLDSLNTNQQIVANRHSLNSGLDAPTPGVAQQKQKRKLTNFFGAFRAHGKRGSKIDESEKKWSDLSSIQAFKTENGPAFTTTAFTGVIQGDGEKDVMRQRALYARQTVLTLVNQLEEALYFVARQNKQWWNYGRQRNMKATKLRVSDYILIVESITKNLTATYADMIKLELGNDKIKHEWFGDQQDKVQKILQATFFRCQAKPNDNMQDEILKALEDP